MPEVVQEVQVEGTFPDGTKYRVHRPIAPLLVIWSFTGVGYHDGFFGIWQCLIHALEHCCEIGSLKPKLWFYKRHHELNAAVRALSVALAMPTRAAWALTTRPRRTNARRV